MIVFPFYDEEWFDNVGSRGVLNTAGLLVSHGAAHEISLTG